MQESGQLDVLAVLRSTVILRNMKKMLIKQEVAYTRELSKSTVDCT